MKEIITRPLSTATPDRAMKPTPAEIDSGMSRNHKAMMPPVRASGTPVKTSSESRTLPKVMKSNEKIRMSAMGTTIFKRSDAEINCSKVPPHVIQLPGLISTSRTFS